MRLVALLSRLMFVCVLVMFGCVLAAIWMPEHWWQWGMTAVMFLFASAAFSLMADGVKERLAPTINVMNVTSLRDM